MTPTINDVTTPRSEQQLSHVTNQMVNLTLNISTNSLHLGDNSRVSVAGVNNAHIGQASSVAMGMVGSNNVNNTESVQVNTANATNVNNTEYMSVGGNINVQGQRSRLEDSSDDDF